MLKPLFPRCFCLSFSKSLQMRMNKETAREISAGKREIWRRFPKTADRRCPSQLGPGYFPNDHWNLSSFQNSLTLTLRTNSKPQSLCEERKDFIYRSAECRSSGISAQGGKKKEGPGGNAFEATNIEVCLDHFNPLFNSIRKPIDLALRPKSVADVRFILPGKNPWWNRRV